MQMVYLAKNGKSISDIIDVESERLEKIEYKIKSSSTAGTLVIGLCACHRGISKDHCICSSMWKGWT